MSVGMDTVGKIITNIPDLIADMQREIPSAYTGKFRENKIPRHVSAYAGKGGGYYTTYGGKRVLETTIKEALAKGVLVPEWDEKPNLEYWKLHERYNPNPADNLTTKKGN